MRVLLVEIPQQHLDNNGTVRTISECVKTWVELSGGESKLVKSLEEADLELKCKGIDWTIIHHGDFEEIDFLRKRHPNAKFAAYSANYLKDCEPGTIGHAFKQRLLQSYNFLLEDLDWSILKMIGKL